MDTHVGLIRGKQSSYSSLRIDKIKSAMTASAYDITERWHDSELALELDPGKHCRCRAEKKAGGPLPQHFLNQMRIGVNAHASHVSRWPSRRTRRSAPLSS
jgi:hypothetical protein